MIKSAIVDIVKAHGASIVNIGDEWKLGNGSTIELRLAKLPEAASIDDRSAIEYHLNEQAGPPLGVTFKVLF